jgi:hypothetical protein
VSPVTFPIHLLRFEAGVPFRGAQSKTKAGLIRGLRIRAGVPFRRALSPNPSFT